MQGDNISTAGDNISTVEGIQYSGGRILISTCLVINNNEKISTFVYYNTKCSFGSFSKIQADSVQWGDNISTCRGITSVHAGG